MKGIQRFAGLCSLALMAAAGHAITFSNVTIQSPPLNNNSSYLAIGNSISFFTPDAIVGDVVAPTRSGTLNIQYDAASDAAMVSNKVVVNLGQVTLGSGFIVFIETIFEIDGLGNEIGGPIGSVSHMFVAGDPMVWSDTIDFDRDVKNFRAKKSFTMSAVNTAGVDLAAIAQINQSIGTVPEPATMAGLALASAAVLRRRRK